MTAESRQKHRRSLSLFSFEHFRSLSRSADRPESNQPSDPLRAPSSLSCDPRQQLTSIPKSTVITSDVTVDGTIRSPTTQSSPKTALNLLRGRNADENDKSKSRPRSWFSLSRASLRKGPIRSLSAPLPKDISSSTVSKSIISGPVLTGTTNMDVAEAEGVCCRDIVDAGLVVQTQEAKARKIRIVAPELGLESVMSIKPRLLRNATARRREKNKIPAPDVVPPSHSENPSEDTWRFSNVERGIARRRAEAINLCRQKINKITGSGHIRRKSVHMGKENTSPENRETGNGDGDIIDPLEGDAIREHSELLSLHNNNSDLAFESLTRSFASAVDKLDFGSSPTTSNMPAMKSKLSMFNIRKFGKKVATDDSGESPKTSDGTQSRSAGDQPNQQNDHAAKLMEAMRAHAIAAQVEKPKLIGAPPEPMQFSGAANGYVPAEPAAAYPRGIKVLGAHSNTMDFATAPSWETDLPKPPRHTPTLEEVTPVEEEDDNEHKIQDAPIYSPSLGDLSQYARPTQPTQSNTKEEKHPELETPISEPNDQSRRRFREIRKSASVLFDKFNKDKKLKEQEEDNADGSQKVTSERRLKLSRSMNFARRFGKGKMTSDEPPPPLPALPKGNSGSLSQPMKPSPLRNEARIEEEPAEQAVSPHAAYKRTPPRDFHTPASRAKRLGMVGMPVEEEDTEQ